jgi:hypothetical protein
VLLFVESKTNCCHYSFVKTRLKVLLPQVDNFNNCNTVGGKGFEQTFIVTCTVLVLAVLSICIVVVFKL